MGPSDPVAVLLRDVEHDLPRLAALVAGDRPFADLVVLRPRTLLPRGLLLEAGFDPDRLHVDEDLLARRCIREHLDASGWTGRLTVVTVRRPLLHYSVRAASELRCARLLLLRPPLEIQLGEPNPSRWRLTLAWCRALSGHAVRGSSAP